jgi:hypothetical protein
MGSLSSLVTPNLFVHKSLYHRHHFLILKHCLFPLFSPAIRFHEWQGIFIQTIDVAGVVRTKHGLQT